MVRRTISTDDGTTISYLDQPGPGVPVVLLHGLAGSSTELVATARSLPHRRVILMDQRGHGRSTRRPADTSREAFVRDVVHLLEVECARPAALVGQSMGAHTAMLVTAARPELVDRLVLLECAEGGGTREEHEQMARYFRSWPVPFADRGAARAFLGDSALGAAWVDDLEERADGLHPRFDPDVMLATIEAVARPRWSEWENLQVPATVVYGAHGMFSPAQRAEFTSRGREVVRVDLPRGSHDAHLDAFDDWVRALRTALDAT
ncbi:alpha/beta hydrolase [Isoptericola sp. S6320L]|uniref:alpha/beta fold hydrolase n=1 Tax=Isoptericola sp. S6320L TaxID=2926411 RepID=UPI001FF5005D|nr:alpha/beta hydrolase [Isoptericola sp. S6320L]MCK0118536.1 alpha/beta hydrolase [Isoptericola sp. S6320L]